MLTVCSIGALVCTLVCMHVHVNMFMHITADNACLQGETALYPAVMKGRFDMVVLLLAEGADVGPSPEGTDKIVSSLIQHNCQLTLAPKDNRMLPKVVAFCHSLHYAYRLTEHQDIMPVQCTAGPKSCCTCYRHGLLPSRPMFNPLYVLHFAK